MKPVLNGSAQNQYIENAGAHPPRVTRAWRRRTLCKMLAKIFTRSYVRERPSYICCVLLALSHFITKEFIAFITPEAVCIFVGFLSSSFKQKLNTIIFLAFTKQAEKSQPRKQHTSCLLAQCIHIPAQLSFPQSLLLPFPSFLPWRKRTPRTQEHLQHHLNSGNETGCARFYTNPHSKGL